MIKTTFKNVGNGDSIILEWKKNNQLYIGIIDCKKFNNTNPVVEHLRKITDYKIYFILLSHPHNDHYSGLLELLEFIEKKGIATNRFFHTLNVTPYYLNFISTEDSDKILLNKILEKVEALVDKKVIKDSGHISLDFALNLNQEISIRCLAPADKESKAFIQMVDYFSEKNIVHCSNAANLLSTIIRIQVNNSVIFLTSDCTKEVFKRLLDRHNDQLTTHQTVLCQIPHHGSIKNYFENFWNALNKNENCPAAFSVGPNKHGHPNYEVITSIRKIKYKPEFTNTLNGAINYYSDLSKESKAIINALDDDTEEIIEYNESDLTYTVE